MLRFKILASTIPLVLAAVFARGGFETAAQPCISVDQTALQIATAPWQAQTKVAFTDDPSAATVRVRIVDSVEEADFTVVDDIDDRDETDACHLSPARFVGITDTPSASEPVIYLSHNGEADYWIFVKSKSFTLRDAAALIVGAHHRRGRIASAML